MVKAPDKSLDRLPPHSNEAEKGVLGCMMLDARATFSKWDEAKAVMGWFYDLRHTSIFTAARKLDEENVPVDMVTMATALRVGNLLEQIGGIPYLTQVTDSVPSATNVGYYLNILRDKYLLRQSIQISTTVISESYDQALSADELVDKAERDFLAIRNMNAGRSRSVKEVVDETINAIEAAVTGNGNDANSMPTGFPDLDDCTGGVHRNELIVLGGFPSVGKSAFAMNLVENICFEQNRRAAFFSLEMTANQLVMRSMCSMSRINMRILSTGHISEMDLSRLTRALATVSKAPLVIEDDPELTIGQIRSRARGIHMKTPVDLWIVDYLQLINGMDRARRDANREQEVSTIARDLKNLAKETNSTVIALSQLNREGRLRESSAIDQHADSVWKLRRTDDQENESVYDSIELFIEKNRNGPRFKTVKLNFFNEFTRFESSSRVEDEDMHEPTRSNLPYKD